LIAVIAIAAVANVASGQRVCAAGANDWF